MPRTPPDVRLIFAIRIARLFAYGSSSVILALYLAQAGLNEGQIGLVLSLTLVGDTIITLWLSTRADRLGRRRMLGAGAVLMCLAGATFALRRDFLALLVAATLGVMSPSGNEVGPFLPIEQAAMAQIVPAGARTRVFAWYNLAGSLATAFGSLAAGGLSLALLRAGFSALESYRAVLLGYAGLGLLLVGLALRLSPRIEVPRNQFGDGRPIDHLGLGRSRPIVLKMAGLFSLDAFGGGFVVQSLMAYWFHLRFGTDVGLLGAIFFAANLLAAASALSAAWLAERIGLLRTMVFTHLPSNVLLIAVPWMPTLPLAIALLLLRFSISQMDVPTRQAYLMTVVMPDERSAAAGLTGTARSIGASAAPMLATPLLGNPALSGLPFLLSGALKIAYDVLLYRQLRDVPLAADQESG